MTDEWKKNFAMEDFELRRSSRRSVSQRALDSDEDQDEESSADDHSSEESSSALDSSQSNKESFSPEMSDSEEESESGESSRPRKARILRKGSARVVSRRNTRVGQRKNYAEDSDEESESEDSGESGEEDGGEEGSEGEPEEAGSDVDLEYNGPPTIDSILEQKNEGFETILIVLKDSRDESGGALYLIKWKGKSHIHNAWESEENLKDVAGYRKLLNYQKLCNVRDSWRSNASLEELEQENVGHELDSRARDKYTQVERVIAMREVDLDGSMAPKYLVKWRGLSYSDCTWEFVADIAQSQSKIDEFLERDRNAPSNPKKRPPRPSFTHYSAQPGWIKDPSLELRDYQIHGVNWLLYSWCEKTNVILADEMGRILSS